jgi:hypothetical protein
MFARGIVSFLAGHFQDQKRASKLLNDAIYCTIGRGINNFRWSDPAGIELPIG